MHSCCFHLPAFHIFNREIQYLKENIDQLDLASQVRPLSPLTLSRIEPDALPPSTGRRRHPHVARRTRLAAQRPPRHRRPRHRERARVARPRPVGRRPARERVARHRQACDRPVLQDGHPPGPERAQPPDARRLRPDAHARRGAPGHGEVLPPHRHGPLPRHAARVGPVVRRGAADQAERRPDLVRVGRAHRRLPEHARVHQRRGPVRVL